jgi:predicted lipoprotein with Yx(FWY)xxD motif
MYTRTLRRSAFPAAFLLLAFLVAACSAGAAASPTPPATANPTVAPATATPAPTATATPAPTATAAPAATATTSGGGGRYGGGQSATPAPVGAVVIHVTMTSHGAVLFGPDDHALYTLSTDSANKSTCSGGCLAAWPPLLVSAGGTVMGGAGVTGKLSSFNRSDGTQQVTYKGLPLYYFASDGKGTVSGDELGGFHAATP